MNKKKHIIIIHGRSTKPQRHVKERLVMTALKRGLQRINNDAFKMIENRDVKVSVIYYGDVLNRIMLEQKPELKKEMIYVQNNWYVPDETYDKQLEQLCDRPIDKHTKDDYDRLIEDHEIIKFGDDVATILSPFTFFFGISKNVIQKILPDLGSYINSRVVASEIRERLQPILKKALLEGDDIVLVSHSMGCIVSYDVLWKFSRMSEYKDLWNKKISLWMTLGNPLGEPAVKESLYDSNEPNDGMYPKNIIHWLNISAKDDFVAHDGDVHDDFSQMLSRNLIQSIEDAPKICTFWEDHIGQCNPHKLYGYLNHPKVAERLIEWMYN